MNIPITKILANEINGAEKSSNYRDDIRFCYRTGGICVFCERSGELIDTLVDMTTASASEGNNYHKGGCN